MGGGKCMNAIINSFGYAGRIFSNNDWNYVVVPKCASSIMIDMLNLKEEENKKVSKYFTFIRLPFARLKSYLYQEKCFTEQLTEEKIKSIISNFDGFNEHCVPYSLYLKKNDFNYNSNFRSTSNSISSYASQRKN